MQEIVVDWLKENYRTLAVTALVVVAVAGGVIWYRWNQSMRRQNAAETLRQGVALFYAARKSDQPDYYRAIAPLRSVIESYPGTSSASHAELYLGHIYFAQGDYSSSLEHYRKAAESLSSESPFLELALLDIAYTQEAKGDYEAAIVSFRRVIDYQGGVLKDRAVVGIGRCLEQLGKIPEAIQTYSTMLERFPNSPWADELRERLDTLRSAKAKKAS